MLFSIELNQEAAAVLLRCLSYGQRSISAKEGEASIGRVPLAQKIEHNIQLIREQVCRELSKQILEDR